MIRDTLNQSISISERFARPKHSLASNLRRAERLIREDGQFGKAVKALHSNGVAIVNEETIRALKAKHPVSELPRENLFPPFDEVDVLSVTAKKVIFFLQSFPKGTSCGRSGWRVSHFSELCQFQHFVDAFTHLVNIMLAGNVPKSVSRLLVSGNLVPLLKKDGSVRPIVVGEVLRRLISKICVSKVYEVAATYLQPFQVGVGVPGGAEALLHGFNRIIRSDSLVTENTVLALIDFKNAFNEVNREAVLLAVRDKLPAIFPWVFSCYSIAAPLFVDSDVIYATSGVQQGDPLGPLLFSLVLQPFLLHIKDNFHVHVGAYLDDVTICGPQQSVLQILQYLRRDGPRDGLHVSSKTVLWFPLGRTFSASSLDGWNISNEVGVTLLGGSVSKDPSFVNSAASRWALKCQQSIDLMMQLRDPQLQLLLLRACVGSPKVIHLLRSSPPCFIRPALVQMESSLLESLRSIIVGDGPWFGEFQFALSTLPISCSGLGVYNPVDVSKFAFVASMVGTHALQDKIFGQLADAFTPEFNEALESLQSIIGRISNIELPQQTQSSLAAMFYNNKRALLISSPYITTQPRPLQSRFLAILESIRQPHASAFLHALPNEGLCQVMSAMEFRAVMALRLLIPKFSGVKMCPRINCGARMDAFGYHAICCIGKQMHERHEEVAKALHYLAFDAKLQPQRNAPVQCLGLSWRSSLTSQRGIGGRLVTNFRPADVLLNWDRPQTCVDVTIVSPIKSIMPATFVPGLAARAAQDVKYAKHADVCGASGYGFKAFAADAFGVLAPDARQMLLRIASLLQITKMYPEYLARQIVFRRISFAIQLGVARQLLVARQEYDLYF